VFRWFGGDYDKTTFLLGTLFLLIAISFIFKCCIFWNKISFIYIVISFISLIASIFSDSNIGLLVAGKTAIENNSIQTNIPIIFLCIFYLPPFSKIII
jgi:hypothetical protein